MLQHKLLFSTVSDRKGYGIFRKSKDELVAVDLHSFNVTVQAIEDELKSQGFTEIPEQMKPQIKNILAQNLHFKTYKNVSKNSKVGKARHLNIDVEVAGMYIDMKNIVIKLVGEIGNLPIFDYNNIISI
jgi:hypothetical protein